MRTIGRSQILWAAIGAATGLAMALGEYLYLTVTVAQFAGPGEMLLFAAALVTSFPLMGAIIAMVIGMGAWSASCAWDLVRRSDSRNAEPSPPDTEPSPPDTEPSPPDTEPLRPDAAPTNIRTWIRIALTLFFLAAFVAGFVTNALAYHRLYFKYHLALTAATFLAGLLAARFVVVMLAQRGALDALASWSRRRTWMVLGATAISLILATFLIVPAAVSNENLRAITSDRGIVSAQVLTLARTLADRDGDGFAASPLGYDCDDSNPNRYPMHDDRPGDGLDQDCSGHDRTPPNPLPKPPSITHGTTATSNRAPRPRRIIIITMDAIRADRWPDLHRPNILPNISRFARLGARFTRAYSASTWTIPSVHAIMTGRYPCDFPFVMAMLDSQDHVFLIDPNSPGAHKRSNMKKLIPVPAQDHHPTIAEELHLRGFVTATVQDIPFLKKQMGMSRGFRIIDDSPYHKANWSLTGITSPLMVRKALSIIEQHANDRLFFYMHMDDPHAPYRIHPETPPVGNSPEARYDAEIKYTDMWVGHLLATLSQKNLLKDSLIILSSDHGEEFRDHGGRYHATTVYEELIHVPLVIVGPGIIPGTYPQLVSHVDLLATILSFVDGACGRNIGPGIDLCPLLTRHQVPSAMQGRVLYAETRRFMSHLQAAVTRRYKLIRDNKAGASMLFDLAEDPKETKNLITSKPKRASALLRAMRRILDAP